MKSKAYGDDLFNLTRLREKIDFPLIFWIQNIIRVLSFKCVYDCFPLSFIVNGIKESMHGEVYFSMGWCSMWCKSAQDVDFYLSVGSCLEDTLEMILKEV